jgi:hypothetical protein
MTTIEYLTLTTIEYLTLTTIEYLTLMNYTNLNMYCFEYIYLIPSMSSYERCFECAFTTRFDHRRNIIN